MMPEAANVEQDFSKKFNQSSADFRVAANFLIYFFKFKRLPERSIGSKSLFSIFKQSDHIMRLMGTPYITYKQFMKSLSIIPI